MKRNKASHNFLDAQAQHRANPDTFDSPSVQELKGIKAGNLVKVCLDGERFWTTVIKKSDCFITATVDNDLVCTDKHGLKFGDQVLFEEKHVYSIYEE